MDINDSLIKSATDPQYSDAIKEYAERGIDKVADSEFTKVIPVVKTVVAVVKGANDIRTMLFLKKISKFLREANQITPEERDAWLERLRLNNDKDLGYVGEKLLLMIEAANDDYKAEVYGKLLKAHVKGVIERTEHLVTLVELVGNCSTPLLKKLAAGETGKDTQLIQYGIKAQEMLTIKDVTDAIDRSSRLSQRGMSGHVVQADPTYYTPEGKLLISILRS